MLEGCERTLGRDHPHTLTAVNNVGGLLQAQGKFDLAEPFHSRALEGCERILGDEHPSTLLAVDNLGTLLQAQG